ncbi:hypothetical protein AZE42_06672 [Rhizopogon vesiculosus]|uniref:Uncharacterized protein n=1 Tax=Rhizopogon vesiculosus TaxID=180088 RepID=A0A1J8Q8H4_9AGAM|nr:hypothetical protein AZE42_06672 [Rhizopogon vesiculosus]
MGRMRSHDVLDFSNGIDENLRLNSIHFLSKVRSAAAHGFKVPLEPLDDNVMGLIEAAVTDKWFGICENNVSFHRSLTQALLFDPVKSEEGR